MENIGSFGAKVVLRASQTFPAGIVLTQFADDTDPFDTPSVQIADKAMGSNGDLIIWSKANPLLVSLAMVPNGDDDDNLRILLNANRVGKGKRSANDEVTITVAYPDGSIDVYSKGAITDGPVGRGVASAGRLKTSTFQFAFEAKT